MWWFWRRSHKRLAACWLILSVGLFCPPARGEIKLLGTASFDGNATDQSGLTDLLAGGIPHNRLGGISAIEYTGKDDLYLLLTDRGPADGATDYRCRFHGLKLAVHPGQSPAVAATLVSTTMLENETGHSLVGTISAFDRQDPAKGMRFDPEGVRTDRQGNILISDEYGPSVFEFSSAGKRTQVLKVPSRFRIAHPSAAPSEEAERNSSGRQVNGGLEGLAIIPDGTKLYAAMQRPLIQDSQPGKAGKRVGTNTRIIEFDRSQGTTREFLYPLDDTTNGVSEILAVNGHEFLILERDGRVGSEAVAKRIYKVELGGATDISSRELLPANGIPAGVIPARKTPFIDLLSPMFELAGSQFPEKVEGLAFGPDLPDGRRLLVVAIDNDFLVEKPILLHAFAIDREDLPGFGW
jgi:hypothetical protein